jgi:hypothetical protein
MTVGSRISLTFPSAARAATIDTNQSGNYDGSTEIGNRPTASGATVSCDLPTLHTVAPGHGVTLDLIGSAPPSARSAPIKVTTPHPLQGNPTGTPTVPVTVVE